MNRSVICSLVIVMWVVCSRAAPPAEWATQRTYDLETRRAHPVDVFLQIAEYSRKVDPDTKGIEFEYFDSESDRTLKLSDNYVLLRKLIAQGHQDNRAEPLPELTIYFDNYSIVEAIHAICRILDLENEFKDGNTVLLRPAKTKHD